MAFDYSQIPLTLKAVSGSPIVKIYKYTGNPDSVNLSSCVNNGTWTAYTIGDTIQLTNGGTVAFSGSTNTFSKWSGSQNIYKFSISGGGVEAYGNILSLVNNDSYFPNSNQFQSLFKNINGDIDSLVNAENLVLSQYINSKTGVYSNMFQDCAELSAIPVLEATVLQYNTYEDMCYGCSNIRKAKVLAVNKAPTYSLKNTFRDCSSLSCIEVKFAEWGSSSDWVNGVASDGIFIKPQALSITRSVNRIPSNWIVLNRMNTKQLVFAQNTTYKGVSYSTGDAFPDGDPFLEIWPGVCFKSTGDTSINLIKVGNPQNTTFKYTRNGKYWYDFEEPITLIDGGKVAFTGNGKFSKNIQNRYQFTTSGNGTLEISGYLSSLVSSELIEDDYEFNSLFSGCSNIVDASELVLHNNTTNWCYANMFIDCDQLSSAPSQLPASDLSRWCYSSMFGNCINLSTAPALPASSLAPFCYYCMFNGCKNLSSAPILSATALTSWCYNSMFYGCQKLNQISCSFTDWASGDNATKNWVKNVAATGTFQKEDGLTAIYGVDNIPNGWTTSVPVPPTPVIDYTTMPLTFKSYGNTKLKLTKQSPSANSFYYNYNNTGWQLYDLPSGSTDVSGPLFSLSDGDTIAFSGTTNGLSVNDTSDTRQYIFSNNNQGWSNTNYLEVYGNVASLINFGSLASNCTYRGLFRSMTQLSSAWNLVLPSTDIRDGMYASLFRSCSIRILPKIIALESTTNNVFDYTFNGNYNIKYYGFDLPNWGGLKGGCPGSGNGTWVRTTRTPRSNKPTGFTAVDLVDGKYYLDNGSGTPTSTEVIVNPDGTITYL